MRYSVGGRNVDILEIKSLGVIGYCKYLMLQVTLWQGSAGE